MKTTHITSIIRAAAFIGLAVLCHPICAATAPADPESKPNVVLTLGDELRAMLETWWPESKGL